MIGIRTILSQNGDYVHALLRTGDSGSILTVAEIMGRTASCEVDVDGLPFGIELGPHEARCLVIGASLAGRTLLYLTSEVIPTDDSRSRFELHGQAGTRGELAFAEPVSGLLNGRTVHGDECHVIRYRHEIEPLVFTLNGR